MAAILCFLRRLEEWPVKWTTGVLVTESQCVVLYAIAVKSNSYGKLKPLHSLCVKCPTWDLLSLCIIVEFENWQASFFHTTFKVTRTEKRIDVTKRHP
jgi:hypothetical protein